MNPRPTAKTFCRRYDSGGFAVKSRTAIVALSAALGLATREQTSEMDANPFPRSLTTTYRLPLTVSWEFDLLGTVRRLPSELLLRRPELAATESGLKAVNAQIGVAKSAFFPASSLTGSAGDASAEIDNLFQRDSRAWSIGPSIYVPLFQGGRNRANYQRSQAAYEEAVAGYRQAILNAFREVQDALTASQRLAEQLDAIARAVANARRARELAEKRYRAGGTSFLEVIDAQRTALAVERSAAAIAGQRWITRVTLIRALGGGWEQPTSM